MHLALCLFLSLFTLTNAHAESSTFADMKSCFVDLGKSTDVPITEIPGTVGKAVPYLCSSTESKISSDFTHAELEAGIPILADKRNVYVYLTDTGLQYAEFPVFYYIVKYHDSIGGYDIGRLPKNFMPIQSSDGVFRVVDSNGIIITIDHPQTKPIDPRVNYSDKYVKLFAPHSLEPVTLKQTSQFITPEDAQSCILKNAKISLRRISTQHLNYTYAFPFQRDIALALQVRNSNPTELQRLKDKYKKTADEVVEEYASILKNVTPSCATTFSDSDYKGQATKTLEDFLPNYEGAKRYIDSLNQDPN